MARRKLTAHIAGLAETKNAPVLVALGDDKYEIAFDQGSEIVGFQKGPVAEAGCNGWTVEALLAVAYDRLEEFQAGKLACPENAVAMNLIRGALGALHSRTLSRRNRGVEGTTKE